MKRTVKYLGKTEDGFAEYEISESFEGNPTSKVYKPEKIICPKEKESQYIFQPEPQPAQDPEEELTIYKGNGRLWVKSNEIAEMLGRSHDKLLNDIRDIISYLISVNIDTSEFYQHGRYIDAKGKKSLCYFISKRCCGFLEHNLTEDKRNHFATVYVNLFNQHERKQKRQRVTEANNLLKKKKMEVDKEQVMEILLRQLKELSVDCCERGCSSGAVEAALSQAMKGIADTLLNYYRL